MMERRKLSVLLLLLVGLLPEVMAQKEKTYLLDLPEKVRSADLFAATYRGEVAALAITEFGQVGFHRRVNNTFEPLLEFSFGAPAMLVDGFVVNDKQVGFYGMEATQGYSYLQYAAYSFGRSGLGIVKKATYPLEGKKQLSFVTEEAAFLLGYTYKTGRLIINRFRPGKPEPEKFEFRIPKEVKLKNKEFELLQYRKTELLTNPGILADQHHIFSMDNKLYLFIKNGITYDRELLMLDLDNETVQRKTIATYGIASQVNIYLHNESLYYYMINQSRLEVTRYDLLNWEAEKILSINQNDENLPSLIIREERDKLFGGGRNKAKEKEVTPDKLLRKLRLYDPYIYVHANPDVPDQIQLVLGSYSFATTASPAMPMTMGTGGTMSFGAGHSYGSSEEHIYVLLGYNEQANTVAPLNKPWKNPEMIWEALEEEVRDNKTAKPLAEWVCNLGAETLILYFDKKEQKLVEKRVPMFEEEVSTQRNDAYFGY